MPTVAGMTTIADLIAACDIGGKGNEGKNQ